MATLQVTFTSTPLTGSKTFTFSDGDAQALIDHLVARNTPRGGGGQAPTPAQALNKWITGFIQGTAQNIKRERLQAAQAAVTVPDLTIT
jgi:hypothetical protein